MGSSFSLSRQASPQTRPTQCNCVDAYGQAITKAHSHDAISGAYKTIARIRPISSITKPPSAVGTHPYQQQSGHYGSTARMPQRESHPSVRRQPVAGSRRPRSRCGTDAGWDSGESVISTVNDNSSRHRPSYEQPKAGVLSCEDMLHAILQNPQALRANARHFLPALVQALGGIRAFVAYLGGLPSLMQQYGGLSAVRKELGLGGLAGLFGTK